MSSFSPARARLRLVLVVALIAAALSMTGVGPATDARAADGTATLSGTVSGFDGRTLSSARVSVYRAGQHVTYAEAGARGEYAVTGLAPGDYDVLITHCCSSAAYISEWGDGTHGATQVTPTAIVEGSNRLDAVMDAGGYLTGTVTGSGENIHATISLIPIDPIIPGQVRRAGVSLGRLWSDPLPPGRYAVVVTAGGWLTEDHNGVHSAIPTEPAIVIGLGETVALAIDLEPAGEISGTVYIDNRDGTRSPAPRAGVSIQNLDTPNSWGGSAVTDADGTYAFRGVDGRYVVQFSDEETLPEFYGGSRVAEGAQIVTVRDNRIVGGIDVTLDVGGRIAMTPRLQGPPGRPPVYSDYGDYLAFERFDDVTGRYIAAPNAGLGYGIGETFGTSAPLEPGTYRVIAYARDQIGADFDDSTFSVQYSAQVNDVVVRAAEVTTVGWVTLTTDYYDPIHPPAPDALPRDAGSFVGVDPARLLDTRVGTGAPALAIGPGRSVDVQVTGRGGVPASGVGAAVMNLTVTGATSSGFITASPTGRPQPDSSNLNFSAGQTIANLSSVKVGAGGKITLTNNSSGTVHLIADAAGFHPSGVPSSAGTFETLQPRRILDTRSSNGAWYVPVPAFGSVDLQVTGRGGVAWEDVSSVVLNVTAVNPAAAGFITAYPTGTAQPTASNLNFARGQTIPNLVAVKLGVDGRITLTNNSAGAVHMLADVAGYSLDGEPTTKGAFVSLDPARLLDTRVGNGARNVAVGANQTIDLQVTDRAGVPASGVSSVVMNVTVTDPKASGFITAYPSGSTRPTASNLNFTAGQTIPNLVTVKVGDDGKVKLTNSSGGTVHLIADVAGYYLSADQPIG